MAGSITYVTPAVTASTSGIAHRTVSNSASPARPFTMMTATR
jgi:hypothetical protein